jgi:hypothetical protein
MNEPVRSQGVRVKEKNILKHIYDEPECFRAAHMPKFCWLLKDFNLSSKIQSDSNKNSAYKSRNHYFERKLNSAAA